MRFVVVGAIGVAALVTWLWGVFGPWPEDKVCAFLSPPLTLVFAFVLVLIINTENESAS